MASLTKFQVTNFRNIHNSGWIEDIGRVTALLGQNESGTSNLCEALYKLYPFDDAKYDYEFDWPVDLWEKKNPQEIVCRAKFALTDTEASSLLTALQVAPHPEADTIAEPARIPQKIDESKPIIVELSRNYVGELAIAYENMNAEVDKEIAWRTVSPCIPKLVYMFDYDMSGQQIELPHLAGRLAQVGYSKLTPEEE